MSRVIIPLHLAVTVDGKASKLYASQLIFSSVHPDADSNMSEYHKLHHMSVRCVGMDVKSHCG